MTSIADVALDVQDFTHRLPVHPDAAEPVTYLLVTTQARNDGPRDHGNGVTSERSLHAGEDPWYRTTGRYKVTKVKRSRTDNSLMSAFKVETWTDHGWTEVVYVHPENDDDGPQDAAVQVHLFLHSTQPVG